MLDFKDINILCKNYEQMINCYFIFDFNLIALPSVTNTPCP